MEKKKYELCVEVLRRFDQQGLLKNLVLVGSWCLYFYEDFFAGLNYTPTIRTRDIDFLVPLPPKIGKEVDIPALLKDLGFVIDFVGGKGYLRLNHPDLIVEFLVPERGRGSDRPYHLAKLKMNAQPLRYLDFLANNKIRVRFNNMVVNVPHPAAFALHKLLIQKRRARKDKSDKDTQQALMILDFIKEMNEFRKLRMIYNTMHGRWKKAILTNLSEMDREDIIKILSNTAI
ncbi:MAG: nucleotidyltransferase domain-containing protein [Candidatus Margulisbacteria bacterium]|nr:nucleotidyltransferase domain-containing protein [Candidatus Margulisiibacteriota bacterium]